MIPDSAIEAAHKAWREQAAMDGSIFEYNLRAAIEAAAPLILAASRRADADEPMYGPTSCPRDNGRHEMYSVYTPEHVVVEYCRKCGKEWTVQ